MDKIYIVSAISFSDMHIQAAETDLDALDIPASELFDLSELKEFRIILENKKVQAECLADEKYRPIYERQAKENQSKAVSESNKNRENPYQSDLTDMDNRNSNIREKETNPALVNLPNMDLTLPKN